MKKRRCCWTMLSALMVSLSAGPLIHADDQLIPNADMEKDGDHDQWPDGWPRLAGNSTWEKEEGNHFIRVKATEPDKMLALYRQVPVPAGVKAMQLTFRVRGIDIKAGKQPWFDGRIIMDFRDASGEKISPSPSAPYVRGNTKGWIERTTMFMVPEGVATIDFMPALFQVQSGTMDLDDIVLKAIEPAKVLEAEAKARENIPAVPAIESPKSENFPQELKVVGNRLQDSNGKEVWLQGVHVGSLDWNPRGENVLAAVKQAIEVWKAKAIRLAIKPDYWLAKEPAEAEAFKTLLDNIIHLAANRGVYVVIDSHTYRAVRESDIQLWTEIATRYKNNPAVLFEPINEPHTISWEIWKNGGFVDERKTKADEDAFTEADQLKKAKEGFQSPGMQKIVEVIRATGAKNIIVAGGLDWAYDLSGILKGFALEDKSGNGIMYSAHIYPWKSDWQGKVLDVAAHYPIFVGEVGANTKKMDWMPAERQEDAATWVPDMLGLIQKYKLNWTAFCFHPSASPVLLLDWKFTPNPEWGVPAKEALNGKQFELKKLR